MLYTMQMKMDRKQISNINSRQRRIQSKNTLNGRKGCYLKISMICNEDEQTCTTMNLKQYTIFQGINIYKYKEKLQNLIVRRYNTLVLDFSNQVAKND